MWYGDWRLLFEGFTNFNPLRAGPFFELEFKDPLPRQSQILLKLAFFVELDIRKFFPGHLQ